MIKLRNNGWTRDEIDMLKELIKQKWSFEQISNVLGRTKTAIRHKSVRLKLFAKRYYNTADKSINNRFSPKFLPYVFIPGNEYRGYKFIQTYEGERGRFHLFWHLKGEYRETFTDIQWCERGITE